MELSTTIKIDIQTIGDDFFSDFEFRNIVNVTGLLIASPVLVDGNIRIEYQQSTSNTILNKSGNDFVQSILDGVVVIPLGERDRIDVDLNIRAFTLRIENVTTGQLPINPELTLFYRPI